MISAAVFRSIGSAIGLSDTTTVRVGKCECNRGHCGLRTIDYGQLVHLILDLEGKPYIRGTLEYRKFI